MTQWTGQLLTGLMMASFLSCGRLSVEGHKPTGSTTLKEIGSERREVLSIGLCKRRSA